MRGSHARHLRSVARGESAPGSDVDLLVEPGGPKDVLAAHPEIPWAEMRAMQNIVVHEYFGVTHETLWKTAREDLPTIVEPLRKLLAATP